MRSTGLVLTLVICACAPKGGGAPSKTTAGTGSAGPKGLPPPPPQGQVGATCESAIANSMTLTLAASSDADRAQLKTQLDDAKPKMIAACHEDQWSAQLLDCLDKARTDAATGACADMLTPAQNDGVKRRLGAS